IISGVGFLGAGVILRSGVDSISGLTRAEIVWGAAGVGIEVGAGFYIESLIGVRVFILSVQLIRKRIFRFRFKKLTYVDSHVFFINRNKQNIPDVISQVEKEFQQIDKVNNKDEGSDVHIIEFFILVHANARPTTTYARLKSITGIELVQLQT